MIERGHDRRRVWLVGRLAQAYEDGRERQQQDHQADADGEPPCSVSIKTGDEHDH
jgi:hypothetical protein